MHLPELHRGTHISTLNSHTSRCSKQVFHLLTLRTEEGGGMGKTVDEASHMLKPPNVQRI